MPPTSPLSRRSFLAGVAGAALLAACGDDVATDDATDVGSEGGGGGGRTVEGVLGETYTFEGPPERVFGDLDVVASLGVVPVGSELYESSAWAPHQLAVLDEERTETVRYTDGPNFEAVAATRPDLILTAFADEGYHRRLADIAPTVYIDNTRPWREVIRAAAVPLFREQEAEAAIADVEQRFAAFREQHPELAGRRPAVLYLGEDLAITALTAESAISPLLEDLGFGPIARSGDPFGDEVSIELLAGEVPGDFVLVMIGLWRLADPEEPIPAPVEELLASPLLRAMPAAAGGVHVFPDEGGRAAYYFSPLYLPTYADLLRRALADEV